MQWVLNLLQNNDFILILKEMPGYGLPHVKCEPPSESDEDDSNSQFKQHFQVNSNLTLNWPNETLCLNERIIN